MTQGDGFIAQVVAGLRRDSGDAQLQLMAGDVLLSAYDLPLADIACLTGESRFCLSQGIVSYGTR